MSRRPFMPLTSRPMRSVSDSFRVLTRTPRMSYLRCKNCGHDEFVHARPHDTATNRIGWCAECATCISPEETPHARDNCTMTAVTVSTIDGADTIIITLGPNEANHLRTVLQEAIPTIAAWTKDEADSFDTHEPGMEALTEFRENVEHLAVATSVMYGLRSAARRTTG